MRWRGKVQLSVLLCVLATSTLARAQINEADRQARCANNQAVIERAETELGEIPGRMTSEEIARARAELYAIRTYYAKLISVRPGTMTDLEVTRMRELASRYGTTNANDAEGVISERIDAALRVRPRVMRLEAAIAQHQARKAELRCGQETQSTSAAPQTPDISGTWFREGDRQRLDSVQQRGSSLTFTNELTPPMTSRGHFRDGSSVIADDWEGGLVGTLSSDGKRIDWANGTSWQR
jgi:hypothetical protein